MKKQSNLKKLLGYAGRFRYLTIASWILSGASALVSLLPFIYIWKIIKEVIEVSPHFEQAHNITHNGWAALGFAVLAILVYISGLMCSHIAAFRIAANIRIKVLAHIMTLPVGFIDSFGTGHLRKIINESSAATETYLAHQLPDKAGSFVMPFGLLFLLLFFDWKIGLLCLATIFVAFVILFVFMIGPGLKTAMKNYQTALDRMSNEAVEYVRGIPVVKTFGQSVFSFKHFKDAIDDYGKFCIDYTRRLQMPMAFYTTIINGLFAVLISSAIVSCSESVSTGYLLNLLLYIIITPLIGVLLNKIMYASEQNMVVEEALGQIDNVLDVKSLYQSDKPLSPADNSIELKNVSFRYKDADTDAIHDVSLAIKPGEHVAFVGPSGGGKTTLASLIARFWDVCSGSILLGGVNVKDIAAAELSNNISFVFQDSKLIKGTIMENVRMAKPEASDKEVMQALNDAQCNDILDKMPQGANTLIGTNGVFLSGGEQQRISIARVILRNTPILILDEATAFADPDNETKIQSSFTKLAKDKTMIMIAHRLSTVVSADRIFVLKDGSICESGSHNDLLQLNGVYAKMWKDYNKSINWKIIKTRKDI